MALLDYNSNVMRKTPRMVYIMFERILSTFEYQMCTSLSVEFKDLVNFSQYLISSANLLRGKDPVNLWISGVHLFKHVSVFLKVDRIL